MDKIELLEKKKKRKYKRNKKYPVHYVGMIGYGPLYHDGMGPDYARKYANGISDNGQPLPPPPLHTHIGPHICVSCDNAVDPATTSPGSGMNSSVAESLLEESYSEEWKNLLLKCIYAWYITSDNGDFIRCFIMPDGVCVSTNEMPHFTINNTIINRFQYAVKYGDLTEFEGIDITPQQIEDIYNHLMELKNKYYNVWKGGSPILEVTLNGIRCNGMFEHYIVIDNDKSPTSKQYATLTDWLSHYYDDGDIMQVTTRGKNGGFISGNSEVKYAIYDTKKDPYEDVIKNIKRYYVSGVLLEKKQGVK